LFLFKVQFKYSVVVNASNVHLKEIKINDKQKQKLERLLYYCTVRATADRSQLINGSEFKVELQPNLGLQSILLLQCHSQSLLQCCPTRGPYAALPLI